MTAPLPRVTRVGVPDWVLSSDLVDQVDPGLVGGQVEWAFAIPWAYRALASPSTGESMIAAPTERDPHEQRRAYWTTLLNLLCFRLGWSSPERGLEWWESRGRPTEDPTLALVTATWLADGRLPLLRSWLAEQPSVLLNGIADRSYTDMHPDANRPARRPEGYEHRSWDGPWSLHLEEQAPHVSGPLQLPERPNEVSPSLLRSSLSERRAVLIVDSMLGWYALLARHGNTLPDLGQRSWRVDVFARPVGHLGTFRRSRVTGAWFTGRHRTHVAGN